MYSPRCFANICVYAHGLFPVSASIAVSFHFSFMFCRRRTSRRLTTSLNLEMGNTGHGTQAELENSQICVIHCKAQELSWRRGVEAVRLQSLSQVPTQTPRVLWPSMSSHGHQYSRRRRTNLYSVKGSA